MGEPVLLVQRAGDVATIVLNRPAVRNALDRALAQALTTTARELARDERLRAVVLRGSPPAFCAGADLRERIALSPEERTAHTETIAAAVEALAEIPVPTIAVISGACLAGGAELALACDLRFADTTARFGFPEVRRGIFPGAGGMLRLPQLVGPSRAADLLFSGRIIDAEEALRIGLIDRLCEPGRLDSLIDAWLGELRQAAPTAVRTAKAALRRALTCDAVTLADIRALRRALDHSPEYEEGLRAFAERRAPNWVSG
ncbi:enoyl-CoA hydratase/isomerase family protein [Thermomicrobium sp. 4228-Ro]|uniref:enoyl-CoA hydratase/isomerase family protein n=1 Tax=Thermomicrobium sp. 4228-Ro TaxID=2993937 RepID=UPI00224974C6|nr:enoyl-CoA hydratase/isomerase family protein [Thermomicrobium sp. 4228-Ro]MCX2727383.1 enoyl-CoA hydratase/isomerase family protein [Thermomicrobium sp. 4228-Ro]